MFIKEEVQKYKGFTDGSVVKNPPAMQEMQVSIPGLRRSPGGGQSNTLQYSCLETSMDRGALQAIVQEVTESDTTEVTEHACMQGIQREAA